MVLDLRSDESITALNSAVIDQFGRIDIVFNNALGRPTDTDSAAGQLLADIVRTGISRKATMDHMPRSMWNARWRSMLWLVCLLPGLCRNDARQRDKRIDCQYRLYLWLCGT